MSKFGKRDILLHFDEDVGEIIFYTVDSESAAEIRKREFDGARSDVKRFQEQTADEAEKALGSMVFSLIESFSLKKIGIREYEALSQEAHQEYVAELEAQAASGNPEALYNLFIERHSRALREKSLENLEEAEKLLRESAALGYEEARDRLENDWQLLQEAALRSIQRGQNT
jgi:hypothetical protein